jgi:hypothetical protein
MRVRTSVSVALAVVGASAALAASAIPATAATPGGGRHGGDVFRPGDLLVSESYYSNDPNIVAGQTVLPTGVTAIADGDYPYVFNNATVDGSFGVTSRIVLSELSPNGRQVGRIAVPGSEITTSFSSKSELALNLSTNGKDVTFAGYDAAPDELDVSNANTPGVIDPTNPVTSAYYREVAVLGEDGRFSLTKTNAYSGDNGRAAILANGLLYTAGNAGNGSTPQPDGVILGAGAQIIHPGVTTATPTPVGSFNVTELGDKADKIGKDDNFRGLAIHNNVLYYTKGSGSNGVNTVYFLDTTAAACPDGTGVPAAGAPLPTSGLSYDLADLQSDGLPDNMCVLKGFPTTLAKSSSNDFYPFGLWFANADTLYVADEGSGTDTYDNDSYTAAATDPEAGLQKWVYEASAGEWKLAYTLQTGLNLGAPYTVRGYPTGINSVTGLPWSPATDGLRNITGRVNPNGTVTIWAITSTVSGGGDQGADPNKLVEITDRLNAASLPAAESFRTLETARFAEVLRGVSLTPGTR